MDQLDYVRGKLTAASKAYGAIARIARETKIDHRTVRAVLNEAHNPHVDTVEKLAAYFRKADRRAKQ